MIDRSEQLTLGPWLKQRRKGLDLTQEGLAQHASCSVTAIKKIEAGDLIPSKQLAELLATALQVPDAEQAAFVHFARLPQAMAPLDAFMAHTMLAPQPAVELPSRTYHLPAQLTAVIGREREVVAVCKLLRRSSVRLLTLTGPAGTGKTRLSLEVAALLEAEFADHSCFVPLAATSDATLIVPTIARTLGLRETPGQPILRSLQEFLYPKALLLVLDNFEQLVAGAAVVTELLQAAPQVKALVTSRAILGVYGEQEFPVPPLNVPDIHHLPPVEAMAMYPAVELFVERAQALDPSWELTPGNATAVANICAWLDGLPLAIEMAAARVKWATPQVLLTQLSQRLEVLTGGPRNLTPRQQTLRGALDWSYNLLTDQEQQLFRRLAVFVGGCTVKAAEAVWGDEGGTDVQSGLMSLLDKSLLRQEIIDDEQRFSMLLTIREYAEDRLTTSGEKADAERRHAAYFLHLAEQAETELHHTTQAAWLLRLEQERDNLQAALHCASNGGDSTTALRLSGALWQFWRMHGHLSEGRKALSDALACAGAPDTDDSVLIHAKALVGAGALAWSQGDYEASRTYHERSLALFRQADDQRGIAEALTGLGRVVWNEGDNPGARALHEQSLALFRQLYDQLGMATALSYLGEVVGDQGDYTGARACFEESLALLRELGGSWGIAVVLNGLGRIAWFQGDFAVARSRAAESLTLRRAIGDPWGSAYALLTLGRVAGDQGDYAEEQSYHEESLLLLRRLGDKRGAAIALNSLGHTAGDQGDAARARELLTESLALYRQAGDTWGTAFALANLGRTEWQADDYPTARPLLEESLAIFRQLGDAWGSAYALVNLGHLQAAQGEAVSARQSYRESLAFQQVVEDRRGITECLEGLACVAGQQGSAQEAARLWGAAEALREAMEAPWPSAMRSHYAHAIASARSRLEPTVWADAWASGRAMHMERLVASLTVDHVST